VAERSCDGAIRRKSVILGPITAAREDRSKSGQGSTPLARQSGIGEQIVPMECEWRHQTFSDRAELHSHSTGITGVQRLASPDVLDDQLFCGRKTSPVSPTPQ
jgi:hypothetical protein